MRLAVVFTITILLLVSSGISHANDFYQVPVPEDAREFSRLDSKMPAVMSFFSLKSVADLRDYYIEQLGQPNSEQVLYDREHLYFTVNNMQVRILISSRDDWSQVDIMVQN